MSGYDYATASMSETIREAERRKRAGIGGHGPPRRPVDTTVRDAPAPDDGVRCVTLPWSLLVSDNDKHVPARRGKKDVLLLSRAYAQAKNKARAIAQAQVGNRPPLTGRLAIAAVLVEPNRHVRRDLHNYGKLVLDVLKGIAYADDSQIDDDHWTRAAADIDAPRLAIRIHTLSGSKT